MYGIIQLGEHHQEQHEPRSVLRCGKLEVSQVAETEDHEHEAPLGGAYAAQEPQSSFVDQPGQRQEQEDIHWNEDNEHPVPFYIDPVELQRNGQIGPQEQPPVRFSRTDHGEIFFQREEGKHHQGQQGHDRVEQSGQAEDKDHAPPGFDAEADPCVVLVFLQSAHQHVDQMDCG
ncbi:hypothetical protein D3C75_955350 [compost metagenome]